MKTAVILLVAATLLQGCAPLTVAQQSGTETPATADAPQRKNRAGTHMSLTGPS